MSRWIGIVDDPTPGGSRLDDLVGVGADPILKPNLWIPATSAQFDPGVADEDRNNEVRGRRGNTAPIAFMAQPKMTFDCRAYPKITNKLVRMAIGGAITGDAKKAPEARLSTIAVLQEGDLPAVFAWLVREGETDRGTGLVVSEFELKLPVDKEGELTASFEALYHDSDDTADVEDPDGSAGEVPDAPKYDGFENTYKLRDAVAFTGTGVGVELADFAGFTFTYNNGLITDAVSRFRPNHNIETTELDGEVHELWYPERHKLGPQGATGSIDLSGVDPDAEIRRVLRHAEKLRVDVSAGPAGTTPAADEMLRLVLYRHVRTGGGPDPLQREGDQRSSYDFTAYIDPATNKDVEAIVTAKDLLA